MKNKLNIHIMKLSTISLLSVGVGFLMYGGYQTYLASSSTQHIMKQSKGIKDVYGQGAKGKEEHQNRIAFDKIYYKYVKADDSTLVNVDHAIPVLLSKKLTTLAKKTGVYYTDSYSDKAKEFALYTSIQNDYIALWQKNKVNHVFAKDVRPSTIYLFNSNHYNDLQTLLAINPNNQYPIWMTSQMQAMGNDAIRVETLMQSVSNYFDFPTSTKAWYVTHSFTSGTQSDLLSAYDDLGYNWKILSFLPSLLDASTAAGLKNQDMQQKVNDANAKIASINAASIASSQAKAESESIASSEKAASEASSKASESAKSSQSNDASSNSNSNNDSSSKSSDTSQSSNNASSSQSQSSDSSNEMPDYVGRSVDIAIAWAKQHNVRLMTQPLTSGNYADREIISQSKNGDTYYISYYQGN